VAKAKQYTESGTSPPIHLCECGCGEPTSIARQSHTKQKYVKGQPMRFARGHHVAAPLAERFWKKVNKNGPVPAHYPRLGRCWVWTGSRMCGYGCITVKGKRTKAHRVAFFLENEHWPVPWGLHRCDNPICVRPSHIFEGTHKDNDQDKMRKGRQSKGSRHGHAVLSEVDVVRLRRLYGEGNSTHQELADEYGVCRATVSLLIQGSTWKHVPLDTL
jgi:hypothetical protein